MAGRIDLKPLARSHLFSATLIVLVILGLILIAFLVSASFSYKGTPKPSQVIANSAELEKFSSDRELVEAFNFTTGYGGIYHIYANSSLFGGGIDIPYPAAGWYSPVQDYSTTNLQVAGVDEADIVKTDGSHIYLVSDNKLIIVKAYPADEARIVSTITADNFTPQELLISGNRLLVLGSSFQRGFYQFGSESGTDPSRWPAGVTTARLYNISSRADPQLIKTVDIEGGYDTSRMIGDYAYFVVDTYKYPGNSGNETARDFIPRYREGAGEFRPIANATDIYYILPVVSPEFVTVCSIKMTDGAVEKETIVGSACQVFASRENIYLSRSAYESGWYGGYNTTIVKLHLDGGRIEEAGSGKVPGCPLNQFSMDEYNGYFRVATTRGSLFDGKTPSTSNVYVLDEKMNTVGSLEGLAPGEDIHSTRFMGQRCYMVTFKNIDPLFVIDLSDPSSPKELGKLKIPGYSDYLQPYDDTHLIGIGKDAVDASEEDASSRGGPDFALYQGVKMAMFDVSDVEHPKELNKVVIGDRGSDSPALADHKALLFDREKGLLVLPVLVTQIKGEKISDSQCGQIVFQGAYAYDISRSRGFILRGNVTHYDSAGGPNNNQWYYTGDHDIMRSLYLGNALYTLSQHRLQVNDLRTLEKLKAIDLSTPPQDARYDPSVSSSDAFYQFQFINNNTAIAPPQ